MEKEKIVLRKRVVVVAPIEQKPALETAQDIGLIVGRWAVMRQSKSLKRMHLAVLHETYEKARNEAKRLRQEYPDHGFAVLCVVAHESGDST